MADPGPLEPRDLPAEASEASEASEAIAVALPAAEAERLLALSRIVELASESIEVVDTEVRLRYVNPAFEQITGYSSAEVLGRTTGQLFRAGTHDPSYYAGIMRTLREGRVWRGPLVGRRRDGRLSFQEATLAPYGWPGQPPLGFVAIKRDADRDVLAARSQENARDRARDIIDHAADGVLVHDFDGRIADANPRAAALLGIDAETLEQSSLCDLLPSEDGAPLAQVWGALQPGDAISRTATLDRPDDRDLVLELRSSCVQLAGDRFVITTMRDVTEERALQAQLRQQARALHQANDELRQMVEQVKQADRAKSAFLANMSHEIRTPMNGVLGMVEALARTPLDADQRSCLDVLRSSGEALLAIINDVLDLSKIESGHLELEDVDFDLVEAVETTVALLSTKAREKDLELICRIRPDVPTRLRGDPGRYRQVLINLLGNALKFTPAGEVEVDIALIEQDEQQVLVEARVRDSGIGIAKERLSAIFEPFVQADASTTRTFGGTGLGLTICRKVATQMGGSLEVESQPGKGSTFCFRAKLQPAREPATRPAVLSGQRVLVIDDNAASARALSELLRVLGAEVEVAEGAAEGLGRLVQAPSFQLALVDLRMPGMDGIQLCSVLRSLPALRGLRLVALSADAHGPEAARAREAGFETVLGKPARRGLVQALVDGPAAAPLDPRPAAPTAESRPLRLLLVDDNAVNRMVATRSLQGQPWTIICATNGREAIEVLDRDSSFDLVLMDIQMPEMDGWTATRTLRSDPRFADLPIVAMTAHAMEGEVARCREAGMNDYIAKPIRSQELIQVVLRNVHPTEPAAPAELRLAEAAERLGGDEDLVADVAGFFLEYRIELQRDLDAAIAASDPLRLSQLAHTTRGAASQLGAPRLVACLQQLEITGRTGDATAALPLAREASRQLADFAAEVEGWLASRTRQAS